MDTTNNNNTVSTELNIRDISLFILSKVWIVALVTLCLIVITFLYVSQFVTPVYSASAEMFIINTTSTSHNQSTTDWTIGKQIAITSSELISGNYCSVVAEALNQNEIDTSAILGDDITFSSYYGSVFGKSEITANDIRSYIDISVDEETSTITVTATTKDPMVSAIVSNVILDEYDDYINSFMNVDTIRTQVYESASIPTKPSNIHTVRSLLIAAVVGIIATCGVLVVFYIFDDKIKCPEDIQKHLNLSVLGVIPEIEDEEV